MNVFDTDIFTLQSLTASINEVEYKPRRLAELGLFTNEGINTTSVLIEREGMQLGLVPAKERGAPGDVTTGNKRTGLNFTAIHLPTTATILADEVQNVREFGSADGMKAVQSVVNKRLAKMAGRLDVTHEYQRMGAIKGLILDADGTTPLVNLYSAFDIEQKSVNFVLGTAGTDIQLKCLDVLELIEEGLGDLFFSGAMVLCGSSFWRKLISHPKVRETYMYQQGERLRADGRESFSFGGLTFERYRGTVSGIPFVAPTEAYAIPQSAEGLFMSHFAPADYDTAVNTIGLPLYASSERMKHGKGVELEAQSNPIHLCTRPQAIIKLTEAA